jgi:AcrR family transcriptional regulator
MPSRGSVIEVESLKDRIVRAAGHLFTTEGYAGLSMRRVAQEVGCSQMAMYRHFANKEALVQHICTGLYTQFATQISAEIEGQTDANAKLRRFIHAVLQFAEQYPDHYALIFLMRHSDPEVLATREKLGQQFLAGIAQIVRYALPATVSSTQVSTTLRRMMETLHGLTSQRTRDDVEALWNILLERRGQ